VSGLRLGILSDVHCTSAPDERAAWHNAYDFAGLRARVERALAWFAQEDVDLVVLCGDLTHHGDSAPLRTLLEQLRAGTPQRVLAVAGNHDVADGEDMLARELAHLGDPRLAPADVRGELLGGIRLAGVHLVPTIGYFGARLREQPALDAWGEEPVVLASHLPLLSRAAALAARGMPYPGDLLDRVQAADALRTRRAPTVVVCGHIHARDVHAEGSVLQLTQAALIEPPFDAVVLDVRPDGEGGALVTRRTLRTGEQRAAHEPALAQPDGAWRFVAGGWSDADVADPLVAPAPAAVDA
jgi:predicted phosphodiesterase